MRCRRPLTVTAEWWAAFEREVRGARSADAVVDFFSRRTWDAFHTGTFSRPVSAQYVQQALSRFLAETPYSSIVTAALWAAEPHPGGHGWHSHALISLCSDVRSRIWAESCANSRSSSVVTNGQTWRLFYRGWKESWYAKWGRCRIYPVRNQTAMLTRYVLKYVLKTQGKERPSINLPAWDISARTDQDLAWGIILQ